MKAPTSTAENILDVAQSLIIAGGYNGFSYADISDAIGIRKASIHHHFPTKAELVAALVTRYEQRAVAGLAALREHVPDPSAQLKAYGSYWRDCILDASAPFCVCAMLAAEIQMLPPEVASGVRAHFRHLVEWLTSVLISGAEQGLFRLDGPAETEAQSLTASVHGAMLSARAFGDPALFGRIIDPQVARLHASLSPGSRQAP